jgi:hypothetical protein
VQVADLKVISSHQFRSFDDANATVRRARRPLFRDTSPGHIGGSSWLEIQWTMRRGRANDPVHAGSVRSLRRRSG